MSKRRWLKLMLQWAWHPGGGASPMRVAQHEAWWDGWREGRRLERDLALRAEDRDA